MAAFDGYKVKDRSGKVERRRNAMPVNGRSVFVLQAVKVAQGHKAAAKLARMAEQQAAR